MTLQVFRAAEMRLRYPSLPKKLALVTAIWAGVAGIVGCEYEAPPPAPERSADDRATIDPRVAEEQDFLDAYKSAHEPHIVVYVHRNSQEPMIDTPLTRTDIADLADANTLDRAAMEQTLSEWLSCGGQVYALSSNDVSSRLSAADMQALAEGNSQVLGDLADKLGADVLIEVQSQPVREADQVQMRTVAQAITVDGNVIGNAEVEIAVPTDSPRMIEHSREMAEQLMEGMARSWEAKTAARVVPISRQPLVVRQQPALPANAPATAPSEQMEFGP